MSAPRFAYARIDRLEDIPPRDERIIDVAVLDMNHGLPNVGHHAIVNMLVDATRGLNDELEHADLRIRAISYPVRHRLVVPRHDGRHRLYLGTGGPGHPDPRRNLRDRGEAEIREDPSWEPALWELFDAIVADEQAALYGVCHTFGLLCRWSGIAEPVLRGEHKGGKMSGVGSDALTPQALAHPWFERLGRQVSASDHLPVLESRYYDLIPRGAFPATVTPIAYERPPSGADAGSQGGPRALTMAEFAREDGVPRVFAVNNHPEIGSGDDVAALLDAMLAHGTITREVHAARSAILPMLREDRSAERLRVAGAVFGDLARLRLQRLVAAA